MICCVMHAGSGLGDIFHRYITVRTLAEEKGYDFGVVNPHNFKGKDFMNLDMGKPIPTNDELQWNAFNEKETKKNGADIRSYDPEVNFVQDWTVIDGSFEDFKYWGHNLKNINEWLKVEPLQVPDDTCIINFRGGEYALFPDLFLTKDYWDTAIQIMRDRGINHFQVHTDDVSLAREFFPEHEVIDNRPISHSLHSNIGFNWRSVRFAKNAIIANSAFGIIPRNLKHFEDKDALTLAPRYHAGYNVREWRRPCCYYPSFTYI